MGSGASMDEPLDIQRVDGFLNAPTRLIRRLAVTAKQALLRADELEAEKRRLEELTGERSPVAVLVYRDGRVEVYGDGVRAVVAHVPDYPASLEQEAIEELKRRVPYELRDAVVDPEKGSLLARGNVRECPTLATFQAIEGFRKCKELAEENAVLRLLLESKDFEEVEP